MTDKKPAITEQQLDDIGTPIIAFASVAFLAAQFEALGTFDDDALEGARTWPEHARENMLDDLGEQLSTIAAWVMHAQRVLDEERGA